MNGENSNRRMRLIVNGVEIPVPDTPVDELMVCLPGLCCFCEGCDDFDEYEYEVECDGNCSECADLEFECSREECVERTEADKAAHIFAVAQRAYSDMKALYECKQKELVELETMMASAKKDMELAVENMSKFTAGISENKDEKEHLVFDGKSVSSDVPFVSEDEVSAEVVTSVEGVKK